jgi:type II secretory pathway component PulK
MNARIESRVGWPKAAQRLGHGFPDSNRRGIVMMITLIVLVVLAGLAYTLTARVTSQVQRNLYVVDYQAARYACDSVFKYYQSSLGQLSYKLIDRPNEPDYSDLFRLSEEQYQQFLADYVRTKMYEYSDSNDSGSFYNLDRDSDRYSDSNNYSHSRSDSNDPNDPNASYDANSFSSYYGLPSDPNKITIPGPYGPAWPLITEPIELTIGATKVKVEVEDENAKFPIIWAATTDRSKVRSAQAALDTFLEWAQFASTSDYRLTREQIVQLKSELMDLSNVMEFGSASAADANKPADSNSAKEPNSTQTSRRSRFQARQKQQQASQLGVRTAASSYTDFSRLFNSSLVRSEMLAVPYIKSERRTESAMKYIDRWGSTQVNVNTAPRHVLEALFTMGGDAQSVAEQIIIERKNKPFKDYNDLQKRVFRFADSITRCKDYIITESKVFTIKITAYSGVATVRLTAAVLKDGKNMQTIGIISE